MLFTHESRLKALLALEISFRNVKTTRPRIVFLTPTVVKQTLDILDLFNVVYIQVPVHTYFPPSWNIDKAKVRTSKKNVKGNFLFIKTHSIWVEGGLFFFSL